MKTKKLEVLEIDDILNASNENLNKNTNHYLKMVLFNIRVVFRHNKDEIDSLIDAYYEVEDMLCRCRCGISEIKQLIKTLTNLMLDDNKFKGELVIYESIRDLIDALYIEVENHKIDQQKSENPEYASSLNKIDPEIEINNPKNPLEYAQNLAKTMHNGI